MKVILSTLNAIFHFPFHLKQLKMTGRPSQTQLVAKKKEKEENIWPAEEKEKEENI